MYQTEQINARKKNAAVELPTSPKSPTIIHSIKVNRNPVPESALSLASQVSNYSSGSFGIPNGNTRRTRNPWPGGVQELQFPLVLRHDLSHDQETQSVAPVFRGELFKKPSFLFRAQSRSVVLDLQNHGAAVDLFGGNRDASPGGRRLPWPFLRALAKARVASRSSRGQRGKVFRPTGFDGKGVRWTKAVQNILGQFAEVQQVSGGRAVPATRSKMSSM
jgi:hypothetical protein